MTLLEVEGLRRSFDSLVAVDGVSFTIDAGELVGMIGPNGAGKTTTFDCISGVLDSDAGTVTFDGRNVTNAAPPSLARAGLVRTFQRTRELTTMTVEDNVLLPTLDHPGERAWPAITRSDAVTRHESAARRRAMELLDVFDLTPKADDYASSLSGGQRKLLELARSLMLDPTLLLLDEPFAGVNPTLTAEIVEHIRSLNEEGMAFLIVEHEMETLTELVDRLVVLANGRVLTTGTPSEILDDQRVIDAYLGA